MVFPKNNTLNQSTDIDTQKTCKCCTVHNEMYVYCHYTEGLFSSIMRELTSIAHDGPKWIVLDGDIDPMWIESLNTVMDDNKVCENYIVNNGVL